MMCVMDFLTPFGYRARARQSDDEPGNEFNLLNSLWFATASVLQQGPDSTPLAPSGRLLASTFWFFILILISTYTANLAAFFTSKLTWGFHYVCTYVCRYLIYILHRKGTQKAAKISNKNSFFNWVHSLHTELLNASHSTNLFTNSYFHQWQSSSTLSYKPQQPTIPLFALTKG